MADRPDDGEGRTRRKWRRRKCTCSIRVSKFWRILRLDSDMNHGMARVEQQLGESCADKLMVEFYIEQI
jgi:hypothetical protein